MMREWRRLYRLRGFAPFGMLLIVLLAVLVVTDRAAARWTDAAQRREVAERKLTAIQTKLKSGRRIDESLASARARLAAASGKAVAAPDPTRASESLAQEIRAWLRSLDATAGTGAAGDKAEAKRKAIRNAAVRRPGAVFGGRPSRPVGGEVSGVVNADVAIEMTTSQLIRMFEHWRDAPYAMRLVRLEVTVDNPEMPKILQTRMRVEGLYQSTSPTAGTMPFASRRPATRNAR